MSDTIKVQGKEGDWHAQTLKSDGVPMVDAGIGRPLILRVFEFSIKPGQKEVPLKQDIFNSHWAQIRALIWSDGLVASTDVNPRVIIGKKRYRIFILCEPKFRTVIIDKPTTLQDIFKKIDK